MIVNVYPRTLAPFIACKNGTAGHTQECPKNFKCTFPVGLDPQTGLFYGLCELNEVIPCSVEEDCPSPTRCSSTNRCII
ncbi:unnamed protein product [Bursaphelenchus okinawaensis]|uniref:Uncharacterized protein n=1 Tax=Bursaphelenchus okinawaensis TaxID=465554 RepID=A0A811L5P3_9BILA|nr:unnamed protein product [Bursaphelenchus okinawaensis]CAG9117185.1 unnamed protein product [Bursaphelenchus okinawaensis]